MSAGVLFALTLPGLVCLLVVLAALEGFGHWLPWRRRRSGPRMTAVGVEELDAFMSAGKRQEIETRASHSLMRDEVGDNAPPGFHVDFDAGVVALRPRPDEVS